MKRWIDALYWIEAVDPTNVFASLSAAAVCSRGRGPSARVVESSTRDVRVQNPEPVPRRGARPYYKRLTPCCSAALPKTPSMRVLRALVLFVVVTASTS
jgi:hypothetical protein